MKIAVWVVFSLLTLLWTAGAFITVKLTQWGMALLETASVEQLGRDAAQWPLPEGLPLWIDPASILALQNLALLSLEGLRNAMPYVNSMMGLLVPAIWLVWGFGLFCLLALAGGAHWMAARHSSPGPAAA